MTDDRHLELHPLGDWIWGKLEMHLRGGHVASLRICQSDADAIRRKVMGEASDRVDWASAGWIAFEEKRIDLLDWTVDADCGWKMTPEQRDSMRRAGLPNGPVRALLDVFQDEDEPRFSLKAMSFLAGAATHSRARFESLARLVEGDAGVDFLEAALVEYEKQQAARSDEPHAEAPESGSDGTGERSQVETDGDSGRYE